MTGWNVRVSEKCISKRLWCFRAVLLGASRFQRQSLTMQWDFRRLPVSSAFWVFQNRELCLIYIQRITLFLTTTCGLSCHASCKSLPWVTKEASEEQWLLKQSLFWGKRITFSQCQTVGITLGLFIFCFDPGEDWTRGLTCMIHKYSELLPRWEASQHW